MTGLEFPWYMIVLFLAIVTLFFYIDLSAHQADKPVSMKSALIWTGIWFSCAMAFAAYLAVDVGPQAASLFLAGYALELTLSVDNLMVFVAVFTAFAIPEGLRHRVLYWGIIGAIAFRMVFLMIGTAVAELGPVVEIIFALIVGWTAWKMLTAGEGEDEIEDYTDHFSVRIVRRFMPVWPYLTGNRFFLTESEVRTDAQTRGVAAPEGEAALYRNPFLTTPGVKDVFQAYGAETDPAKLTPYRNPLLAVPGLGWILQRFGIKDQGFFATPLFLCLIAIDIVDVLFAFDSVPAVIGVTKEPVLVYTSVIFAILGLRSLYFALAALLRFLVHLEKAVIALLFFIALKLFFQATKHLLGFGLEISPGLSLAIVILTLAAGVIASFIWPETDEDHAPKAETPEAAPAAGASVDSPEIQAS